MAKTMAALKAKPPLARDEKDDHEHHDGESAKNLKHWMNVNSLVSKYQNLIRKKSFSLTSHLQFWIQE